MTELSIERPARRFLHICYCCADDQEVAAFIVEGLDMKPVMRTTDREVGRGPERRASCPHPGAATVHSLPHRSLCIFAVG